jgi:hypothetical protein
MVSMMEEKGMILKNIRLLLPLALLSLALSALLHRVGTGIIPRPAFFEGMFLGLATALATASLCMAKSRGHYE